MKTHLISEAPPPGAKLPHPPLAGKSGQSLSEMVGFSIRGTFQCHNVLDYIPERTSRGYGMSFPLQEAQVRAKAWLRTLDPEVDRVVIVGYRCTKAFRMRGNLPMCDWFTLWGGTYLTIKGLDELNLTWIPHPSSTARNYQRISTRKKVVKFLQGLRDEDASFNEV